MKKRIVPILALLTFIVGCESTPHYNDTKIAILQKYPKKPYGSVKLFQSKPDASVKYDVIAFMSIQGNAGEEAAYINAFLYRAADIGADAVIVYRSMMAGEEGGAWFAGAKGGFGLPTKPTQEGVYRAEAIHFK